jgi:hypothetical protein
MGFGSQQRNNKKRIQIILPSIAELFKYYGLQVSVWVTAPKLFQFVLKKDSEIAPRRR